MTVRRRRPGTLAGVILLSGALLAGCTSDDNAGNDTTEGTDQRTPQTAPAATGDAKLTLQVDEAAGGTAGEAELKIGVTAPERATEMQVGTDPSFATANVGSGRRLRPPAGSTAATRKCSPASATRAATAHR